MHQLEREKQKILINWMKKIGKENDRYTIQKLTKERSATLINSYRRKCRKQY